MFVVLRLTKLALEFGSNLIQQLIEARGSVARGHAPHTAMRIHGHFATPKNYQQPKLYCLSSFFKYNIVCVLSMVTKECGIVSLD